MRNQPVKGGEEAVRVKDVMTVQARCCSRDTSVAAAAALMLDGDCGMLPVLDDGHLVGVVTDRDLFIALATRNAKASELTVGDVSQAPVFTCGPDADVRDVLEIMRHHAVRRVPVEGLGGAVLGIVSMSDIVRAAGSRAVRDADIVQTLQSICAQHRPVSHVTAA